MEVRSWIFVSDFSSNFEWLCRGMRRLGIVVVFDFCSRLGGGDVAHILPVGYDYSNLSEFNFSGVGWVH